MLTSPGATYDSIEGRFRIIKREATALKTEAESGTDPITETVKDELDGHDIISRAQIATPKKGRAPKTPVKKENGTVGGRINKSANNTPTKRKTGVAGNAIRGMKEEILSSESSMTEEGMLSNFGTQEMAMEDWGMSGAGTAVCEAGGNNVFQSMMGPSSVDVRGESFDLV